MIYQPRNVQPSSNSIDADIDNTFTMEMQTNSYISAYQLSIIDFNNNPVYTGTKEILSEYLYNEDTLSIPVNTNFGLSNGVNYKWRTRLYQPLADMLITYGLIQSESTATNIYLQKNINIRDTMKLTIGSETKTISSYDISTGLAIVSEGFSSAPTIGTQYYIYSDFIETVPDYIFYARKTPSLYIENVPNILTRKYYLFKGVYVQNNGVPIVYHIFNIYILNKDGSRSLVNTSGKIYSANLSYQYNNFRTGNTYYIEMIVENDMGIISQTNLYSFDVSYQIIEYLQQPQALFDSKQNAIKISWSAPIEHDATSFRSDAATGIIQDNSDTFTQATFEPGQSIGEGDVIQTTNADFDMILYGKSTQETRSGKNLFNYVDKLIPSTYGLTSIINSDGSITVSGIPTMNYVQIVPRTDITSILIDKEVYTISQSSTDDTNVFLEVRVKNKSTSSVVEYYGRNTSFTVDLDNYIYDIALLSSKISTWGTETKTITGFYQLEKGDTVTSFEPYGAMPSPEFPSEIKTVKGIENLLNNKSGIIKTYASCEYYVYSENKIKITSKGKWSRVHYKISNLKANTKYTLSANIINSAQINAGLYESDSNRNIGSELNSYRELTITSNENGEVDFQLWSNWSRTSSTNVVEFTNLQLEEGSIAHPFVPYGSWLKVKDTGKNLFDKNKSINSILNADGTITLQTNTYFTTDFILIDSSKTYCKTITNSARVKFYDSNRKVISTSSYSDIRNFSIEKIFTIPFENAKYIRFTYDNNYEDTIQLEEVKEGQTKPTEYEPYQEISTLVDMNIYDASGNITGHRKLSSVGGTRDERNITTGKGIKKIGEVVLNGSETITTRSNTSETHNKFIFPNVLPNEIKNNISLISSHFETNVKANHTDSSINCICGNNVSGYKKYLYISIEKSIASDVNEFKTWLSQNPVTVQYELATPEEFTIQSVDTSSLKVDGKNYLTVSTNIDSTFDLVYPYKTITGNTNDYTLFNPAGVSNTGTIKSYNALTGVATLMADKPFTYIPMKGDSYAVISNIYNVSGFSYLYDTPYSPVNSLYTKGYTATWHSEDGLCTLPVDYNITFQFSPDSNFFYDDNGRYREEVIVFDTETDEEGAFQVVINKNKLIFRQDPSLSLESYFYDNVVQVFVLTETGTKQTNEDYIWDDTAIWNDNYIWTEGGTSLERICEHWWKVQITKTGIKIEEVFPG